MNLLPDWGEKVKIYIDEKSFYIFELKRGGVLETHFGNVSHEDIRKKAYGDEVFFNTGKLGFVLRVGIVDNIIKVKRKTQIVYPKDMGYILLKLNIKEGDRVLEVGLGSGVMCYAFARTVGDSGVVYSYEKREEFLKASLSNLNKWDVLHRIVFHYQDICEGIKEKNLDSIFLDLPDPTPIIENAYNALSGGGIIGILCPTNNQCIGVLEKLYFFDFINVEMCEIFIREYKTNPNRLRPKDRMYAHTAYLVFAEKLNQKRKDKYYFEE